MDLNQFQTNKYVVIKDALPKELLSLLSHYFYYRTRTPAHDSTIEVDGVYQGYGDPLTESMLANLLPLFEENAKTSLYPTSSLFKIFNKNSCVKKNLGGPSEEVVGIINLGFEYYTDDEEYNWSLFLNDTEVILEVGDILLFKAHELELWSNPLTIEKGWQAHAVLNYVIADGSFNFLVNDGRPGLGYPQWSQDIRLVKRGEKILERIKTFS